MNSVQCKQDATLDCCARIRNFCVAICRLLSKATDPVNLRNLDLNLLLVFDTVYATRSNTRAALKLGVTQSAVSNALRRLRAHLNDALFERRGNDYVPTPRAERLAPAIRGALHAIEASIELEDAFDPLGSDRIFSMVLPDPLETRILAPMINLVTDNGYGIGFDIAPGADQNVAETLSSKRADVAIVPNPMHETDINSAYLFDEDMCLVCRAGHPEFADRDEFTLDDMPQVRLVSLHENLRLGTHDEQEFREKRIARTITCTVTRHWSLPAIVASTDLFATLPRSMAEAVRDRFSLKVFDFPIERPAQQWHLVWHRDSDLDQGHKWLRDCIKTVVAGTL